MSNASQKPPPHLARRALDYVIRESNFFRLHVAAFTFLPLIIGSILYACNGQYHISYLDMLFITYSAMAGCGLSTVNLSTLTGFQQSVLFILMTIGHFGVVSFIMVLVRKRYFQRRCKRFVKVHGHRSVAQVGRDIIAQFTPTPESPHVLPNGSTLPLTTPANQPLAGTQRPKGRAFTTAGGPPILSRSLSSVFTRKRPAVQPEPLSEKPLPKSVLDLRHEAALDFAQPVPSSPRIRVHSATQRIQFVDSPVAEHTDMQHHNFMTNTGQLEPPSSPVQVITSSPEMLSSPLPDEHFVPSPLQDLPLSPLRRRPVPHQLQVHRPTLLTPRRPPAQFRNSGGFPVASLVPKLAKRILPKATYDSLHNKLTSPVGPFVVVAPNTGDAAVRRKETQLNWAEEMAEEIGDTFEEALMKINHKVERWINFDGLKVFRNSNFDTSDLTEDQFEEIGGIEYRALRLLSYLVPMYTLGVHLISFLLIAPWMASTTEYDQVFENQPRLVPKAWFAAFQVVGAYTGGGFSLCDTGMVPFQSATLMIFSLMFAILAGNHAFPIFLRLTIWICTKFCKTDSETDKALHFLLDHPRRCFIYLFPAQQTWFLFVVLVFFSILEWASFIVLNIGLDITDSLPVARRVLIGLFQGIAARASGFAIVSVGALAPALVFLYIVMMYIAVFPIAMSIRSTNVYEERSLGVYQAPESEEPLLDHETKDREAVSKYLSWHLKKQLAFDLWWLVAGIFLICVIERSMLMDDANAPWFNLFRVIFEMVSAYGGVGLSLGVPYDNFAFSGSFKPLSKIVTIIIIVRGRHRGLPMAVDRAVMLPEEFSLKKPEELPTGPSRAQTLP